MRKKEIDFTPKTRPETTVPSAYDELLALIREDHVRYAYVEDICEILDVSEFTARKIIRELKQELPEKERETLKGKIPRELFMSKLYGMSPDEEDDDGRQGV